MHLTLVAPNLLAVDRAALAGVPALARLAGYAGPPSTVEGGIDDALVVAARGAHGASHATLAALGAGFAPGAALVLHADPVSLVAGRDDVLLEGRVDDLSADDGAALLATLDRSFAEVGIAFHAPRPDAWFVTAPDPLPPVTTPLAAVRGPIGAQLPRGERGGTWRRWLSEMQMLLHEHPVNVRREREGRAQVTGIWVWGGGMPDAGQPTTTAAIHAPVGRIGDVARGIAVRSGTQARLPPAGFANLPVRDEAIIVLPALLDAKALPEFVRAWLEPALAALDQGTLESLALIADGDSLVRAQVWNARRISWRQRLRARFSEPAFAPPEPDDDR
jgi:hypothetical protein